MTESLANRDSAEAVYLVLFERSFRDRSYDYGFDEGAALPGVELVAYLDDGAIFSKRRRRCLAVVALPDYEIARLSTGQYVPGAGALWEAAFSP